MAEVIFEAIEMKNLKATRFGDTINEYIYNPGEHGISEMLVWVNKETGRIESAFPKRGANVWKWNGFDWKKVT